MNAVTVFSPKMIRPTWKINGKQRQQVKKLFLSPKNERFCPLRSDYEFIFAGFFREAFSHQIIQTRLLKTGVNFYFFSPLKDKPVLRRTQMNSLSKRRKTERAATGREEAEHKAGYNKSKVESS